MANIDKSIYTVVINRDNGNARTGDLTIAFSGNIDLDEYTLYSSVPEITFTPILINKQTATIAINVDHSLLAKGFYQAQCNAVSWFETIPFTINLSILSENEVPIIVLPPQLKYYVEYSDFTLEVLERGFMDAPQKVFANISHSYASRRELQTGIIASALSIDFDAGQSMTFQDLYSENEGQFQVVLKKGTQVIFKGFLKPDGIWEDFVNEYWTVSVDAMDGLSTLKDIEFPRLAARITQFEALKTALNRTGYDLPINVHNMIPQYAGLTTSESSLNSVIVDSDQFYQSEGKQELMSCEDVINSVLNLYNATLIQMHGEWFIFRSNDVADAMTFKRYVSGVYDADVVWNANKNVGSHIDGYSLFHINSNQRKTINASVQTMRVNYKYGLAGSLYVNPNIKTSAGLTAEGWTIYSLSGKVERKPNSSGLQIVGNINSGTPQLIFENNQPLPVVKDDALMLRFNHSREAPSSDLTVFHFHIETPNYRLSPNGWIAKPVTNSTYIDTVTERRVIEATHEIKISQIPEAGNLSIKVFGWHVIAYAGANKVFINELSIGPADTGVKGEFHQVERKGRVSTVTGKDVIVHHGDSESSVYVGTLRKSDGTPTTIWNRIGKSDGKSILAIMAEDRLRIAPRPMIVFEGDIKGYYPYLSNFTINNITGKFQVSEYNYNIMTDINRSGLTEYETAHLATSDFNYYFKLDYGAETKVTIKS